MPTPADLPSCPGEAHRFVVDLHPYDHIRLLRWCRSFDVITPDDLLTALAHHLRRPHLADVHPYLVDVLARRLKSRSDDALVWARIFLEAAQ